MVLQIKSPSEINQVASRGGWWEGVQPEEEEGEAVDCKEEKE